MVGLLLLSLSAHAASIPVAWREGVHVYTHPEDWRPAGLSNDQLSKLETLAHDLHTPVYVVLVKGEALPGQGNGQGRLQRTTDALMTDWGSQGMDLSRYSVFSVAWGDDCTLPPSARSTGTVCEYFLNTGSEYIHGPAHFLPSRDHFPITNQFRQRVAGQPQDPAGGIRSVMVAVDERIWERIDPGRLEREAREGLVQAIRRADALLPSLDPEERAPVEAALADAMVVKQRADTDELHQMARTLNEVRSAAERHAEVRLQAKEDATIIVKALAQELRYADVLSEVELAPARQALSSAHEQLDAARTTDDFTAIHTSTRTALNTLRARIAKVHAEAAAVAQRKMVMTGSGTAALVVGLGVVGVRRRRRKNALERFEDARSTRSEQLDHAQARYMELELADRTELAMLADTEGDTRRERDEVQAELDDIYAGICALRSALDRAIVLARRAGALDWKGVDQATAAIDAPFDYDTGQLARDQLFTGPTTTIRVHPPAFMDELQARFAQVVARRDRLRSAADIRFKPAIELLPHAEFDALAARATTLAVPLAWLSDHPLYGDDESDRDVWSRIDHDRTRDPLTSLGRLEVHQRTVAACADRIERFKRALHDLSQHSTPTAPHHLPTEMRSTDDPAETWARAQSLELRARSRLRTGDVVEDDDALLVEALNEASRTYKRAAEQARTLDDAVRTAGPRLRTENGRCERLQRSLDTREKAVERAARVHLHASSANVWIQSARRTVRDAQELFERATVSLDRRRHLDALRTTETGSQVLQGTDQTIEQVDQHLEDLEVQQRRYRRHRADMYSRRSEALRKIKGYGESAHLQGVPDDASTGGPVDFAVELAALRAVDEAWKSHVRRARNAYQARQAAARRARERAEREAAAARRRSASRSTSSWGSSSRSSGGGGSFGGGRSSGGGGSFGGGGSTGGGGGW